jgi:hypothetical protein
MRVEPSCPSRFAAALVPPRPPYVHSFIGVPGSSPLICLYVLCSSTENDLNTARSPIQTRHLNALQPALWIVRRARAPARITRAARAHACKCACVRERGRGAAPGRRRQAECPWARRAASSSRCRRTPRCPAHIALLLFLPSRAPPASRPACQQARQFKRLGPSSRTCVSAYRIKAVGSPHPTPPPTGASSESAQFNPTEPPASCFSLPSTVRPATPSPAWPPFHRPHLPDAGRGVAPWPAAFVPLVTPMLRSGVLQGALTCVLAPGAVRAVLRVPSKPGPQSTWRPPFTHEACSIRL